MWLDVRDASRKKDAVQSLQQFVEAKLLAKGWNQQGKRIRRLEHGAGVLLPDHVKRVLTDHAAVGGNSNKWASGCHDELPGSV
jgi:hypothetical protein